MASYPCGLCVLWSPRTTRSGGTAIDLLWFRRSWAIGRTVMLWGVGFLTRRLPLLLPARDKPLCFEDPAFSIGMLCRPSRSTMNFAWLIERVA